MFGGFAAIIVAAVVAVVIRQTCLKETPANFLSIAFFTKENNQNQLWNNFFIRAKGKSRNERQSAYKKVNVNEIEEALEYLWPLKVIESLSVVVVVAAVAAAELCLAIAVKASHTSIYPIQTSIPIPK